MKHCRVKKNLAERIIVSGEGDAFELIKLGDEIFTVYLRTYKGTEYKLLELIVLDDEYVQFENLNSETDNAEQFRVDLMNKF